jgi:predicted GNAT family acetyltransferase
MEVTPNETAGVWGTPRILTDMSQDAPEHPIAVADDPARSRYVAYVDGEVAGYSEYELDDGRGRIVIQHTEVDDAFEGRGVGGALVRGTLDDVRRRRLRVVPQCPFVKAWLDRHPHYQDLLRDPS